MSRNHDYRDYQRDARAFQPTAENEQRRQREMPVGKGPSGKKSGFMQWLATEGRTRFLNTYGWRYDQKNPSDQAKMTEFYKNLPPEKKAALKAWEAEQNSNRQVCLERRRKMNYERRQTQHRNIALHREMEQAHAENLRNQREVRTEAVPMNSKILQIHVTEELDAQLKLVADRAAYVLRSILLTRGANGESPLWHPHMTMQFVSMSPLIYSYKTHLNKVSVYPAEVSITTFHLKTGLQETETRFIVYDAEWFHGVEPEEEATAENRKSYAELIGIPEDGVNYENALSPDEAMQWLRTRFDSCRTKRIICDKNAYNFVFYGLKVLSTYMGHNAVNYFKLHIMNQLLSIQDFAEILLTEAPLLIPKEQKWSKAAIEKAFEFYNLVPCSDQNRICPTHAAMTNSCKLNCTGAHSARILQNFFYILRQNKLADIYDFCDGPAHRPCQVTEPNGLREACFIARTISRNDETEYKKAVQNERESRRREPYIRGAVSVEPIHETELDSEDEYSSSDDYVEYQPYEPSDENEPEHRNVQTPQTTFNPHQNIRTNFFAFAANDNFFSTSLTDPERLTQRAGVRDMASAHAPPPPAEPDNVVPPSATGTAIARASLGNYSPYGIMPSEEHFERPRLDAILSPRGSEKYLHKLRGTMSKMYKPVVLTCL